jgi:isoaspartyl peptidase/L-asparaginase-like protein (Ntn-hydrolase superfamily)
MVPNSGTVAVLVRLGLSKFAAAGSSGGPWLALPGRSGELTVPGAALYVGTRGAVALTGPGETLMDEALARRTYAKLLAFQSAQAAAVWALQQLGDAPAGVLVMDGRAIVARSNAPMAWAAADPGERSSSAEVRSP